MNKDSQTKPTDVLWTAYLQAETACEKAEGTLTAAKAAREKAYAAYVKATEISQEAARELLEVARLFVLCSTSDNTLRCAPNAADISRARAAIANATQEVQK